MLDLEQFDRFDLRVGTVVSAQLHPTARKPAYQLEIDFGSLGILRSSAQLTVRYEPDSLLGSQVIAIVNFPPRRIAGYVSEVLVLGAMVSAQDVVLLSVAEPVQNGTKIG